MLPLPPSGRQSIQVPPTGPWLWNLCHLNREQSSESCGHGHLWIYMNITPARKRMSHAVLFNDPAVRTENPRFPPMF